MPKRKNTFDELPFLSKMHIGVKEYDLLSVNCSENMKKVYEKTQSLLFNGSANLFNGKISENFLKNSVFRKPALPANKEPSEVGSACCSSRRSATCAFCDKAVCSSCCRTCSLCSMDYCHLCSVLQYDTHEETAVCLSCL